MIRKKLQVKIEKNTDNGKVQNEAVEEQYEETANEEVNEEVNENVEAVSAEASDNVENIFKEVDDAVEAQKDVLNTETTDDDDDGYVVFKDVKKTYTMGETQINALNGINFSAKKGELVVVVGTSGAGKTTILNILGGIDKASSGQVIIDGNDICKYNNSQMVMYRRHDVGFVFQFYNLVQNLTARENVELATQICNDPFDVDEMLEAVSLSERKGNFPSQLSGGEQQRVAIARALAKNPKLLLCDEPTGALDYNTGKAILQLLQDTARKANMTVFIITHNYALTGIGDRVIKVKNGMIDEIICNEHPQDIRDIEW